jgi:hypothetical protein
VGAALIAPATTVATSRIVREHSNAGQTGTSVSNDDPMLMVEVLPIRSSSSRISFASRRKGNQ